jgi:hypothetical protein
MQKKIVNLYVMELRALPFFVTSAPGMRFFSKKEQLGEMKIGLTKQ